MSDKQKITFLESVEVRDHNDKIEFAAKAGDVVELVTPSAQRWIRRGLAVDGVIVPDAPQAESDDDDPDAPQQTAPKKKTAKADK